MLNFRKLVKPGLGVVGSIGTGLAINYYVLEANKEKIISKSAQKLEVDATVDSLPLNYYEKNLRTLKKYYPTAPDELIEIVAKADVFGPGIDFLVKYLNADLKLSDLRENSYHLALLSVAIISLGSTYFRKKPVLYNEQAFLRTWNQIKENKNKIKSMENLKNDKIDKIKGQGLKMGSRQNIELIEQQHSQKVKFIENEMMKTLDSIGNRELRRRIILRILKEDKNIVHGSYLGLKYKLGELSDRIRFENMGYGFLFLFLCGMIMVKELNNKNSDGFETVRYQSIVL